jgi:HD-GYP domain-containing protein (c-di-GMP phosphodiesterase class II)
MTLQQSHNAEALKSVGIQQLRVGMYIHAVDVHWWKHPYLRSRFLIDDESIITSLRAAGVREVCIDLTRGAGLVEPETLVADPPEPVTPQARSHSSTSLSRGEELERAKNIRTRATQVVRGLMSDARLGKLQSTREIETIANDMVESVTRDSSALVSLTSLKGKDEYTFAHSVSVATLMIAIGKQLGLEAGQLRIAGSAGLLHDVGKAMIPASVLNKPGTLTISEYIEVQQHPRRGYEFLSRAGFDCRPTLDAVLHHHERLDGSGYPDGLAGGALTQIVRMASIADVYDALTSNRVYHQALAPTATLGMIRRNTGTHYDAKIVDALIRVVGIYPVGSLVKLSSGRLAVVIEQNSLDSSRPVVKAFFSIKSGLHVPPEKIHLAKSPEKIVTYEDPFDWKLEPSRYWQP